METIAIISSFIPLALWYDIFKRLPTKSLCRFRCVSRSWDSLIRSPDFITAHYAAAAAGNTHLFVQIRCSNQSLVSDKHLLIDLKPLESGLNFLQPSPSTIPTFVSILSCADGVLLGSVRFGSEFRHVLCNPCIHRYVVLPEPLSTSCYYQLGLGFVPSKNDIGVVKIIHNRPQFRFPTTVKVCYARERVWKTIAVDLASTYLLSNSPNRHCCTNGRVHWLAYSRRENFRWSVPWRPCEHLFVFDFERERFETLNLPGELVKDLLPSLSGVKLLLFKQNLSVLLHLWGSRKYCLWSLTEYSDVSSWAKVWSFDVGREVVLYSFVVGWRADYQLIVSQDKEGVTGVYDRGVGTVEESYVFPFKKDVYATHVCGFNESLFLSDHPEALPLTQIQAALPN